MSLVSLSVTGVVVEDVVPVSLSLSCLSGLFQLVLSISSVAAVEVYLGHEEAMSLGFGGSVLDVCLAEVCV